MHAAKRTQTSADRITPLDKSFYAPKARLSTRSNGSDCARAGGRVSKSVLTYAPPLRDSYAIIEPSLVTVGRHREPHSPAENYFGVVSNGSHRDASTHRRAG